MTDWTVDGMRRDPQVLQRRLGEFLRPRASAKDLSRLIGCDVRTAENIRQGHWPIARHWLGLVVTFGEDVTEAVFHPERAAERLQREITELEKQLAERRAAHEQAATEARANPRRPRARRSQVVATPHDRTAETVEREPAP